LLLGRGRLPRAHLMMLPWCRILASKAAAPEASVGLLLLLLRMAPSWRPAATTAATEACRGGTWRRAAREAMLMLLVWWLHPASAHASG